MPQENNISKDLYDLLVTRNFDPEATDEQGQASQPDAASVFSFDYVSGTGRNYGTAVAVLTQDQELMLFFGDNLGRSMEEPDKTEWFDFLGQLKNFATRNDFHTFAPRDLSQLRHTMAGMAAVKEGLFEGYYGTRRVSYMGEETDARLMIRHSRPLADADARYRNIASLFIETAEGERFRLPFTHLAGGRAMLEHVRQGGRPYDVRGVHITEMVSELKLLSRFRRASAGRVMEGTTAELIESARQYHEHIRDDLARMATPRGYSSYFESWQPMTNSGNESLVEDIRQLFVEQNIDARIEAVLPILARLKDTNMREANQFESWANRLVEGTWALPDTPEAQAQLKTLMSKPLQLGPDAINATQQLYSVVGDDQLYDIMQQAAQGDPDANIWDIPEVITRMEELGVDMGTLPQGTVGTQEPESAQAPVSEGDNLATFEQGGCNHTAEGQECPVHGLAECGMHESLRDGEHHVATVTLSDGTKQKLRVSTDEGYRDLIKQHFARQGKQVVDIDMDFAVRADEDSTDPMDRRGGVWDSFYEAQEPNPMAQAVTRRIVNQHPEWITRYGVEFLMQVIDDVTEGEGDWEEIGSSDVSAYVNMVGDQLRDRGGDRPEMADRPPFTPGPGSDTDQFGNPIRHRARHLARKGMRQAQGLDEGADSTAQQVARMLRSTHPNPGEATEREILAAVGRALTNQGMSAVQVRFYLRDPDFQSDTIEAVQSLLQGVTEMDSQGYRGHRGDEDPGKGPEKVVKPAKSKDVAKDAEKDLTKAMDRAHKKPGVAEGPGDNKPRFTGAPVRDANPPEIKNTTLLSPAPGRPTFVGKPDHLQSPDPLERLKSLALAKTR